ncbi:MAG: NAD(P)H-quinone oxidoreductase [Gammaproteobacteria bacterium]|nr:NAD(P)H-quinone oxidoreductase [Gammaproteobacteria bacterium]
MQQMRVIEIKVPLDKSAPRPPEILQLAQRPQPIPAAHEVLIEVIAAGINRPDILQRKGLYPVPAGASDVPGLEVAGYIKTVGAEVTQFKIGDAVCALCNGGGYAEYVCVPAGQCLPKPTALSWAQAAALPETFFTVWSNLFLRGQLQAGETVLIHGGSSGIGTTAIMLSRYFGARVITTVGSDAKAQACKALGAETINYKQDDFHTEVMRLTENKGVDVILDIVGAEYFNKNINCLAEEGRLVLLALPSGAKTELDMSKILFKRLKIMGSTLRPQSNEKKAAIARSLYEHVWPILEQAKCLPIVHAAYPLVAAAEAHHMLESSAHIGKLVLNVKQ